MKRTKLLALVNIASFIIILVSAFSGIVLWQILPQGNGWQGGRNISTSNYFLGLSRGDWSNIHNVSSLIFILLIIIHLFLHWSYIKNLPKLIKN